MSSQPQREQDPNTRIMNGEMWLARRLSRFGVLCGIFEGVTDSAERKQRLRHEIQKRGLDQVICDIPHPTRPGKRSTITYAAAFERLYGEKL